MFVRRPCRDCGQFHSGLVQCATPGGNDQFVKRMLELSNRRIRWAAKALAEGNIAAFEACMDDAESFTRAAQEGLPR